MNDPLYSVTLKVLEDGAVCTVTWTVESSLLSENLTGDVSGVRSTSSMMSSALDQANQAYYQAHQAYWLTRPTR